MISDLDIYGAANVLMDRYGQDAPLLAIKRATKMLDAGDLNGYAVWKRILRAVEEMQMSEPGLAQRSSSDGASEWHRKELNRKPELNVPLLQRGNLSIQSPHRRSNGSCTRPASRSRTQRYFGSADRTCPGTIFPAAPSASSRITGRRHGRVYVTS